jgi:hypothetical protein
MEVTMATATGSSGLWGASYVQLVDRSTLERRMGRLAKGMKLKRALALALNGAAAGGAALYTEKRITAQPGPTGEHGGVRTVETNTFVNRNTAAADETQIDAMWLQRSVPSSYPLQPGGAPGGAFGYKGQGNIVA